MINSLFSYEKTNCDVNDICLYARVRETSYGKTRPHYNSTEGGGGVLFYLEKKKLSMKCEEGRRPF